MLTDTERAVAIHLIANALRKVHQEERRAAVSALRDSVAPGIGARPATAEEQYVRGMLDLLTALFGRELANELHRAARQLERNGGQHRISKREGSGGGSGSG